MHPATHKASSGHGGDHTFTHLREKCKQRLFPAFIDKFLEFSGLFLELLDPVRCGMDIRMEETKSECSTANPEESDGNDNIIGGSPEETEHCR